MQRYRGRLGSLVGLACIVTLSVRSFASHGWLTPYDRSSAAQGTPALSYLSGAASFTEGLGTPSTLPPSILDAPSPPPPPVPALSITRRAVGLAAKPIFAEETGRKTAVAVAAAIAAATTEPSVILNAASTAEEPSAPSQRAAVAQLSRSSGRCSQRRLLHWNILDGGVSRRRIDKIGNLVREGAYDVVSMNELNGVSEGRLVKLGASWGLPHVALLHKSPYKLGLLSRHKMEVGSRERS